MKPKHNEWQPLDLVDKEAIKPLRSFNSRVASRDHRYYTLGTDNNSVYDPELDDDDDDVEDESTVQFIPSDPVEDTEKKTDQQRWAKVKILLLLCVLLITCLVVVILVQHFKYQHDTQVTSECTSPSCIKDAAYILNKMDLTVDPCDDFYTFTCGNWEKTTVIPASKAKYGSFAQIADEIDVILKKILEGNEKPYKGRNSTAIHKAMSYYKLCMDEKQIEQTGIQPALELIKDLGGWDFTSDPISGGLDTKWKLDNALFQSHLIGFAPFFSMTVAPDEKNSSKYIIKFEQSGLSLSDPEEYFSNHSNYQELKDAFIQYATDFVQNLGATDVEQKVKDLYNFEQNLAKIHVPKEKLIDPASYYKNMSLQVFQDKYMGNWLNLKDYMQGLFKGIATVTMETQVVVYTADYFAKLQNLIENTNERLLASYIVWISIQNMGGYLPQAFSDAALKLDKVEEGVKEISPRWKRCLSKTNSALGYATGALYVQDNFQDESKNDVEAVFEEMRKVFLANLHSVEWMDEETRTYAIEKAKAVTKMLGYPDYITDPIKLDQHYENLTLVDGKFFKSRISILLFYNQKNLRHFGTIPDRTEWAMIPTEVNGYYSPEFNHIVFPAGILRPPLYNPRAPKSFNFGSFAMICGHELTHGFDNKGREFDKEGNMRNWWTATSTQNFDKKSKCFIDFYHNYTANGTHLNGETTLSENIADNGGMKTAYMAYKSWQRNSGGTETIDLPGVNYSPDQLFFIGMAQIWCSSYTPEYLQEAILVDVHSISKYRVLGSMSNSVDFAKAFQCRKNSPMNPENKCAVW